MTTTLPLNGQIIGQVERATRALLDAQLAAHDTPFEAWVCIKLVGDAGSMPSRDLATRLAESLHIAADAATEIVAAAIGRRLLDGDPLALTAEGTARFVSISASIATLTQRLYGDLAFEDLAATRRVLETVTARARAELARR